MHLNFEEVPTDCVCSSLNTGKTLGRRREEKGEKEAYGVAL
jgi:hypothetical protein